MDKAKLMLAASRYGNPKLPALVLLHGFLGSKDDWRGILPQLSEHFYCISIDLPGHGDSHQVTVPTPGFDTCVSLILDTLEHENIKQFHLHGYSLGGRIALSLANTLTRTAQIPSEKAHNPQLKPQLLSLSLESCHPGLKDPQQAALRQHSDDNWADRMITLTTEDFLRHWYQQPVFSELSDFERLSLIKTRSKNKPMSLYNCYRATSLALQEDLWDVPNKLAVSCHYYLGEQDSKFLALANEWQKISSVEVHRIPDAGHNVHLAAPQLLIQAMTANMLGKHNDH